MGYPSVPDVLDTEARLPVDVRQMWGPGNRLRGLHADNWPWGGGCPQEVRPLRQAPQSMLGKALPADPSTRRG